MSPFRAAAPAAAPHPAAPAAALHPAAPHARRRAIVAPAPPAAVLREARSGRTREGSLPFGEN